MCFAQDIHGIIHILDWLRRSRKLITTGARNRRHSSIGKLKAACYAHGAELQVFSNFLSRIAHLLGENCRELAHPPRKVHLSFISRIIVLQGIAKKKTIRLQAPVGGKFRGGCLRFCRPSGPVLTVGYNRLVNGRCIAPQIPSSCSFGERVPRS